MVLAAAALAGLLVGANPYLEEGRKLYGAMQYEQAAARLKLAAEVPTSSLDERRAAFDLLARTLAALGRTDEADGAYAALLAKDPEAPGPDEASPKIRSLF